MTDVVIVLAFVVAASAVVLSLEGLARAPSVVAGGVLLFGAIATIFNLEGPIISAGSITVYPADVLHSLILGAAFVRFLGLSRPSGAQVCVLIIVLFSLFSVVRGAADDIAPAVNEFRRMFYFLAPALYFVTVAPSPDFLRRTTYSFYVAGVLIFIGALIFWAAQLSGALLPTYIATPQEDAFRVLPPGSILVLAQACLLALPAWRFDGGRVSERLVPILFVPAIVLLQRRTVWILFLVGLGVMAVRDSSLSRKVLIPLAATAVVAVFVLSLVFSEGRNTASLSESLEAQTTTADTFIWRVEGWRALITINGPESTSETFLGAPYGRGWQRVVGAREVTTQSHSVYVENFLRHGLLGIGIFVLIYLWAIARLWRSGKSAGRGPGLTNVNMLLVLAIGQLVYFINFAPAPEQGMVMGIVLAVAAQTRRRSILHEGVPAASPHQRSSPAL